jgi:hypothetical protein
MLYLLVGLVAYVAGCFSHKWAAAALQDTTGVDAQSVADKLKKG